MLYVTMVFGELQGFSGGQSKQGKWLILFVKCMVYCGWLGGHVCPVIAWSLQV
jgi:hypothetical protein